MPIAEKHTGMWSYLSHTCDSDGNALCCLHILTARLQSHDLQSYPAARSTNTFISPRREFQCNLYMLVYMYVFNSHVLLLHLIELMWIIKHVLSNVFHEDWLWLCPTRQTDRLQNQTRCYLEYNFTFLWVWSLLDKFGKMRVHNSTNIALNKPFFLKHRATLKYLYINSKSQRVMKICCWFSKFILFHFKTLTIWKSKLNVDIKLLQSTKM